MDLVNSTRLLDPLVISTMQVSPLNCICLSWNNLGKSTIQHAAHRDLGSSCSGASFLLMIFFPSRHSLPKLIHRSGKELTRLGELYRDYSGFWQRVMESTANLKWFQLRSIPCMNPNSNDRAHGNGEKSCT